MKVTSAVDTIFKEGYDFHPSNEIVPASKRSRQRYDYGSCPVCDAEVNEVCTSTRSDTWGRPISRSHPEREKVPLS